MTERRRTESEGQRDRALYLIILTLAIVAVRIPFYLLYPFRTEQIGALMQLLDPALLREDLLGNILHLHSQPPLYNLLVGIILNVVPATMLGAAFSVLHLLLIIAIGRAIYGLTVDRWLGPRAAAAAGFLATLSPVLLWAERLPGYILPVAAALLWSAVAIQRFTLRRGAYYGILAIVLITLVPMARSFYHALIWMLPLVAGFIWLAFRVDRRRFALYTTIAVTGSALTLGWYVKNSVEYGMFTGSTWLGMNLAGVVSLVDSSQVQNLIDRGELTPLAAIPRLSEPEVYADYYNDTVRTGIPALDAFRKSNGTVNWNHRIYARTSREYQRNSIRLARAEPVGTLRGMANQLYLYSSIVTYHLFNDTSRWWVPDFTSPRQGVWTVLKFYVIPLLIFIALLLATIPFFRVLRRLRSERFRSGLPSDPDSITTMYVGLTILYTTVVACAAELGEGALMRAQVDPLIVFAVVVFVRNRRTSQAATASPVADR